MNKQIHNNKQTNCKQTSKEVIIKEITKKKTTQTVHNNNQIVKSYKLGSKSS